MLSSRTATLCETCFFFFVVGTPGPVTHWSFPGAVPVALVPPFLFFFFFFGVLGVQQGFPEGLKEGIPLWKGGGHCIYRIWNHLVATPVEIQKTLLVKLFLEKSIHGAKHVQSSI